MPMVYTRGKPETTATSGTRNQNMRNKRTTQRKHKGHTEKRTDYNPFIDEYDTPGQQAGSASRPASARLLVKSRVK